MTKKSLRRQLAAAIAMVLVASMALGTSTFAWFVNNNKVTAQGMSVNAVADSSLVIKGITGTTDTLYTSIGTNVAHGNLKPATSKDGENFAKLNVNVQVKSADASAATWNGEGGALKDGDLQTVGGNEKGTYVLTSEYKIASIGDEADVYVSGVDVSNLNVEKALRMSVTIGGETKVYNLGGGTAATVGALSGATWTLEAPVYNAMTDADTWTLPGVEKAVDSDTNVKTATVLIWYEGQDDACFTNNITTAGSSVTVYFSKAAN